MAEARSRLRLALLGATAALSLGGLALFLSAPEPEPAGAGDGPASLRTVETARVEKRRVQARAEVAAVLEPRRHVQLYAETRGPVVEVGAEALDRVEAGRVLVRIDPIQAEVAVERARAALARAESELALARSELARRQSLRERGVASSADLEAAQNAEKVAAAALRQARAELVQARDELAKKVIAAPFAGVLRSFRIEAGEYVQPGEEIGELLDLSAARATIGLSDLEVVGVRPGQRAELRVEAYPEDRFRGEVLRVGAAADPETKRFPVEIELPNPDERLLPGMVGTVVLELGSGRERRVIPREAALDEFGLRFVWVLEPNGDGLVARRRRVKVRPIPFRPAELEVLDGLRENEEIAVSEVRQLRNGDPVVREGGGRR